MLWGRTVMRHQGESLAIETGERRPESTKRMFKACIGRFDDPAGRALIAEPRNGSKTSITRSSKHAPPSHQMTSMIDLPAICAGRRHPSAAEAFGH